MLAKIILLIIITIGASRVVVSIAQRLNKSRFASPTNGMPIISAYFKTYTTIYQTITPLPDLESTNLEVGNKQLAKTKIIPGPKHNKNPYRKLQFFSNADETKNAIKLANATKQ